jgi:adenylate cyclase class 2
MPAGETDKMAAETTREGPVEVEVKLPVADLAEVLARISAAGYQEVESRSFESNVLYDTEEGALRQKQQALRIREYRGEAILTFKGKPIPGKHKQREELETVIGSAEAMAAVLERLGYVPLFRYEKFRRVYAREGALGVITVDETPLGAYLELEGEPAWIDRTAQTLGFAPDDYVTASYATIYLEHCRRTGATPGHFIFSRPLPQQDD